MTVLPAVDEPIIELAMPDGDMASGDDVDVYTSKLGSMPVWFNNLTDAQVSRLNVQLQRSLTCPVCGHDRYLVAQMDCPREEHSSIDRICYIFGCNTRRCSQQSLGWSAIFVWRGQDRPAAPAPSATGTAGSFWDSLMSAEGAKAEAAAQEVQPDAAPAASGIAILTPKVALPGIYLHIEEELVMRKRARKPSAAEESRMPAPPAQSANADEDWSGEQYEKFRAQGTDRSFARFQKRCALYPRQCVRYVVARPARMDPESPVALLYADLPDVEQKQSTCPGCQQKMEYFEMQLMPAILAFLPTEQDQYLQHIPPKQRSTNPIISDGMEWGTVLVYSCGPAGCLAQQAAQDGLGVVEASVTVQVESQ